MSGITDNGPNGPVTFVKAGPGYVKIGASNSYSGGTYYLQGRISSPSSPYALGSGPAYVFPGAYIFAPPSVFTNQIYLAGNGTQQEPLGAFRASTANTNNITLIGDATIGGSGGNFFGPISGPFNMTFGSGATISGTENVTLSASNSWTGNTIIQSSNHGAGSDVLINGTNEVIPSGFGYGNVFLAGCAASGVDLAVWNLNGFTNTINGLSDGTTTSTGNAVVPANGVITNASGTLSGLVVGNNDASGSFGGTIGGNLALTKIGAGTETLNGTNFYTGATTISNGTLAIGLGGSIPSAANILVYSGGTLDVNAATSPAFTAANVGLSGGTLYGNVPSPGITGALGLTNGALDLIPNTSLAANVFAGALNTGGTTNVVNIIAVGGIVTVYPTNFTLIQYSGTIGGAGLNIGIGACPTRSREAISRMTPLIPASSWC